MDVLTGVDWRGLFAPGNPVEFIIRGTAMYWFLFLLFRVVIRRRIGAVGMADFLVLAIIADASQNGMAGTYTSVTDGMVLVATLVGWTHFTDWLSFRFPKLQSLLEPPPLLLVKDGRILHRNLRAEFITEQELRSKLRENGVAELAEVKAAYMESDGTVSVVTRRARGASSR